MDVAVGVGVLVGVLVAVGASIGGRKGVSLMPAVAVIVPVVGLAVPAWNSAAAGASSPCTAGPTASSRPASTTHAANARIAADRALRLPSFAVGKSLIDPVIISLYAAHRPALEGLYPIRQP